MAAGRPTLYNDEIIREAWAYIQNTNDEWDKANSRLKVNVPTVEGLALHLEVTRSTVYLWQKEYSEFSDIIETLLQKQAQALINNGLSGSYNPTIAKVLLTKHGYTDKQEIDQKTEHSGTVGFTGINIIQPGDQEVHP
jgi:NAD/NADP transhydrogenase alpha subunit